eukprot:CAMPEP_0168342518 /NCGR_PEP_ID=MMETSP0213-20121227/15445_1 /TAXON_ID=151035 /ORGANISM="Euplotes harpa, Strain FSP1.4" /LENGTH=433 /DNA_ID=CAMNT_0008349437 /DNA_START=27 /DNA_END=1328 /DNA_ORIENTATION=-
MGNKRRMKQFTKNTRDELEDIIEINKLKQDEAEVAELKDSDLFVINEGKSEDIKRNREKLAKDRFKQYHKERSKSERDKVKKFMTKTPPPPQTREKETRVKGLFDIWATPEEHIGMKKISKNKIRDRNVLSKSIDKIRRVVVPHAGQSYNPPAVEHQKVISKIVEEEVQDIQKEEKIALILNPDLRPEVKTLPEQIAKLKEFCQEKEKKRKPAPKVESESDEEGPTKLSVNPPVDRANALTPKERKMRKIEKQQRGLKIHEKKMRMKALSNKPMTKKRRKLLNKIKKTKEEREKAEKEAWEKEGIVSKPRKLGLYKYQKPKTDFAAPEELPDALRKQKGSSNLIKDQFDSFFRRNLLPVEAPPNDRKKLKEREYKQHRSNTEKEWIREQEKKGDVARQLARDKLRDRKRKTALLRGLKAPTEKNENDEDLIFI